MFMDANNLQPTHKVEWRDVPSRQVLSKGIVDMNMEDRIELYRSRYEKGCDIFTGKLLPPKDRVL
jgi:hypothetical protein